MTEDKRTTLIVEQLNRIQASITGVEGQIRDLDSRVTDVKESLQEEILSVKGEMLQFQLTRDKLEDVYIWSKTFRETVTISEVERLRAEVEVLRQFRAKASMIFVAVQFAMGAILFWMKVGG